MAINKDLLVFDETNTEGSDNVGAFIRSSDGTQITHTDNGTRKELDVNVEGVATSLKQDAIITELENQTTLIDSLNDKIISENIRQLILKSQDRQQTLTYADFGTKDERITKIEYTSSSYPGVTAVKQFEYTLVGNKYRRDEINWSII